MFTAYSGNSAYCYSNGLHMCLSQAGMADVPSVGMIECLTGMPFGAMFLELDAPLFFPSPAAIDPDIGVSRALEILGWTCELWRGDEVHSAQTKLHEALEDGPVLLGPLDMGFLPYDPDHQHKRGGDHYIVALETRDGMLQVHDPQLYPFAMLPMDDVMRAWYAKDLGYAEQAYNLRWRFREKRIVSRSSMLDATLTAARELVCAHQDGPVVYGGPAAHNRVAEILHEEPPEQFTALLTHFALPVAARRSIDAARFLEQVDSAEATTLFIMKAQLFGQAQYYGAQQQWDQVVGLFNDLARVEAEIAECL